MKLQDYRAEWDDLEIKKNLTGDEAMAVVQKRCSRGKRRKAGMYGGMRWNVIKIF